MCTNARALVSQLWQDSCKLSNPVKSATLQATPRALTLLRSWELRRPHARARASRYLNLVLPLSCIFGASSSTTYESVGSNDAASPTLYLVERLLSTSITHKVCPSAEQQSLRALSKQGRMKNYLGGQRAPRESKTCCCCCCCRLADARAVDSSFLLPFISHLWL